MFGRRARFDHHLTPITKRELSIAAPLLALAILFGVYPQFIFNYLTPSVNKSVDALATWTQTVKQPELDRAKETETAQAGVPAAVPFTADVAPAMAK